MGVLENRIDLLARNIESLEEFLESKDMTVSEVLEILYRSGHIDLEQELEDYEET